jgi:hypothetical protein
VKRPAIVAWNTRFYWRFGAVHVSFALCRFDPKGENDALRAEIAMLKALIFGTRSERAAVVCVEQLAFGLGSDAAAPAAVNDDDTASRPGGKARAKARRNIGALLAHLPVASRWSNLLRRCEGLAAWRIRIWLERAFPLARDTAALAPSTIKTRRRKLECDLGAILSEPTICLLAAELQAQFARAREQLLTFCDFRGMVEATNNACERDLRPSVIQRKVTNGHRAKWGVDHSAAVRTTIDTARLAGGVLSRPSSKPSPPDPAPRPSASACAPMAGVGNYYVKNRRTRHPHATRLAKKPFF